MSEPELFSDVESVDGGDEVVCQTSSGSDHNPPSKEEMIKRAFRMKRSGKSIQNGDYCAIYCSYFFLCMYM